MGSGLFEGLTKFDEDKILFEHTVTFHSRRARYVSFQRWIPAIIQRALDVTFL